MNKDKGEGPNKRLLPPFVQYIEWLQLSCLSTLMFVAGLFIPVVGTIASLLSPVPISLIGIRLGAFKAFLAVIFVAASLSLPFGSTVSLSFIFFAGLSGVVFSSLVKKTNTAGEAILGLIIASIIFKIILMGLMVYTRGFNPFTLNEDSINTIVVSLKESRVGEEIINFVKTRINLFIPTFIIIASALDAFINYLFVSLMEKRRKRILSKANARTNTIEVIPIPPIEQWEFPRSVLTAFIFAFLITLLDAHETSVILISVELNLKILTFVMFLIHGFSFVWWWALQKKFHYGVRLSIVFVFLFIPVFSLGLIALGILDIALNLRQRIRRSNT